MKTIKASLTNWSIETFGDNFKQFIIRDEITRLNEELFDKNPLA